SELHDRRAQHERIAELPLVQGRVDARVAVCEPVPEVARGVKCLLVLTMHDSGPGEVEGARAGVEPPPCARARLDPLAGRREAVSCIHVTILSGYALRVGRQAGQAGRL